MSVPVPTSGPADTPSPSVTAQPAASTTATTPVPSATAIVAGAAGAADDHNDDSLGSRLSRVVTVAPPKPGTMTRLKYASYLFSALLFCMVFRGMFGKLVSHIPYYKDACAAPSEAALVGGTTTSAAPPTWRERITLPSNIHVNIDGLPGQDTVKEVQSLLASACLEATIVYRVSFSLFIFFFLHLCSVSDLTCCIQDSVRDEMQSGYFGCKSMLLVVINLISFGIPSAFFSYYAWACMYASAIFLVIQIMILVDFSYEWNETWGARSEENNKWMYYLMFITIGCFVAGVVMMGYGFTNFTPYENCNTHGFILLVNIMLGIVCVGVAIYVPHGSLLPTAIVFSYTSYLIVSALRTSTDTRCGGMGDALQRNDSSWYSILVTSLMTAGTLAYTASSVSGSDDSLTLNDNDDENNNNRYTGHLPAYIYFHGIMVLASMYLAMVGSNWTISGGEKGATQGGAAVSFWVKVASSWLTYGMYLWSLLAPYFCCKHRDFGYDADWQ